MKFIPSFGEFATKGKKAFRRFPITISWAIVGTLFTLFAIENQNFNDNFYIKTILVFSLGISWLIATRFFEEQFKKDKEWLFLITIGFLIFFYTTLPGKENMDNVQMTRLILYFITGHLLVFVAPFILNYNKNTYFNYLNAVFIAIARSIFFSMILYLGIVLALLAIKHLFNVNFNDRRYFQIFILCVGVVNTWIYLSDFPKDVHTQTRVNYTKALEILVKYILIPLAVLYLVILYAYSLKIVMKWSLPNGSVSYLVVALSFLGFIIQMLINPIQKTIDSRIIKKFQPWFYIFLLPLLALLFIAIFRRVSDYGITENRYFVIVLALWVLGMTLYMLFSKKKATKWFSLSLAILAFLSSFGFWSAFSVSTKSQVRQFEKVLNEIKSTNFSTSYDKESQIKSIIRYLDKKKEIDKLSGVLGYNPEDYFKSKTKRNVAYSLIDSLGINSKNNPIRVEKTYSYNSKDLNFSLNVSGYDTIRNIYCHKYNKHSENTYNLCLKEKSNTITVWKSDRLLDSIDCSTFINKLLQQDKKYDIDSEFMSIKKGRFKVVFRNLMIKTDTNDTIKKHLHSANVFLLVKEK